MPISKYLSDKWDERLYNWVLWLGATVASGSSCAISSAYQPELGRSGYREPKNAILSGPAMDTDRLMVAIQEKDKRIYDCLKEWTINDGTRGQQAVRVRVHPDAYKDIVDSGKRELENMDRANQTRKSNHQSKSTRLYPEKG